jgi:hypothetical protein
MDHMGLGCVRGSTVHGDAECSASVRTTVYGILTLKTTNLSVDFR